MFARRVHQDANLRVLKIITGHKKEATSDANELPSNVVPVRRREATGTR